MVSDIEITHGNILTQLECIQNIIDILGKCGVAASSAAVADYNAIVDEYNIGSIEVTAHYFLLMNRYKNGLIKLKDLLDGASSSRRKQIQQHVNAKRQMYEKCVEKFTQKYQIFIKRGNFAGKINTVYIALERQTNDQLIKHNLALKKNMTELRRFFLRYKDALIDRQPIMINYNICSACQSEMTLHLVLSEMTCKCGIEQTLYGTVLEDEQFYSQDGQRTKHKLYDPSRHFREWIDRIQARESMDDKKLDKINKVVEVLKEYIDTNNIKNIHDILCRDIREFLQKTGNSKYYENVSLIRKLITGIAPPQLTDEELQRIYYVFDMILSIYDNHKSPKKTNVIYHPYLGYKIIEDVLSHPSQRRRREEILACIHLQSRETVIDHDDTWESMCRELNMKYVPTDC
jgi:hypothetical protein